jgi:hypothetical protein
MLNELRGIEKQADKLMESLHAILQARGGLDLS